MRYLLHRLVDDAAAREPTRDAVRCRGEALTYEGLARQVNGLAHELVARGVRRGDRVGVLLGKGVACAVAIHAIMKAGAAYVPLDPSAPASRHAFIVEDCGLKVLISEPRRRRQLAQLAEHTQALAHVLGVEDERGTGMSWEQVAQAARDDGPVVTVTEQDPCYILYTSGSTGTPKGIMHSHRSAMAWAEVSAAEHQLVPADRISNYAPLHFDLSTLDYFAGVLAACTMVMVPEEHARMPASLAQLLEEEALTLFYTVPFALIQLVTSQALDGRELPALTRVLFGGEPMTIKHLRRLQQLLPHVSFCNVYGPTEVNGCTRYYVPPIEADDAPSLPIGSVYANVEALVIDAQGTPVVDGEQGELAIRAPTMMRGYWNREDLMASAYHDEPRYPACSPDRFYRTGDLVARRADGSFDFIGRADRLIKTRGCRVDLDEIEATLAACEGVLEAAVFPVTDGTGTLAVHAAARQAPDGDLTAAPLQRALKARLPAYAVPVALKVVDEFPRTTSGKVDRRALRREAEADSNNNNAQPA